MVQILNVCLFSFASSGANGDDYYKSHDDDYGQHHHHHHLRSASTGSCYVLYQFVQLLMKKDKLWCNDTSLCFGRLIRLYFMAMNHTEVYACLRVLYAQTGMTPTKSPICNVIRDFYNKPRTLKQMTRVVIYNAVGQRPALRVSKLPLPASLKEYLLSFEP